MEKKLQHTGYATMSEDHQESEWVKHIPCGTCGSDNNGSLYSDGHTYCHKCGTHVLSDNVKEVSQKIQQINMVFVLHRTLMEKH